MNKRTTASEALAKTASGSRTKRNVGTILYTSGLPCERNGYDYGLKRYPADWPEPLVERIERGLRSIMRENRSEPCVLLAASGRRVRLTMRCTPTRGVDHVGRTNYGMDGEVWFDEPGQIARERLCLYLYDGPVSSLESLETLPIGAIIMNGDCYRRRLLYGLGATGGLIVLVLAVVATFTFREPPTTVESDKPIAEATPQVRADISVPSIETDADTLDYIIQTRGVASPSHKIASLLRRLMGHDFAPDAIYDALCSGYTYPEIPPEERQFNARIEVLWADYNRLRALVGDCRGASLADRNEHGESQ